MTGSYIKQGGLSHGNESNRASAAPDRYGRHTHADDFKLHGWLEHDEDSSFPHENVAAMKASGYTALIVPEELGGAGATPLDVAMAQERLAYGDLPTAIAVNMHHIVVSILADLWRLKQRGQGPLPGRD